MDMGPSVHATSLDSNIWPNTFHDKKSNQTSAEEPLSLFPLELTQSNPLPFSHQQQQQRPPVSSSTIIIEQPTVSKKYRRRTTTPDLGNLDLEDQAALEAEITARRQARRVSRRNMVYDDDGYDDDRVVIGTRVSEGHRNYQLM